MDELVDRFGTHADDPLLVALLLRNGIDLKAELDLPEGEFRAYVERPVDGYALVFTDQAMFLGRMHDPIGAGPLCFSGLFVYLERVDAYEPYQGALPFGLSGAGNRAAFAGVLGPSSWQRLHDDGRLAAERWDVSNGRKVHVTYASDGLTVSVISFSKPDAKPQ
jgi:hypothetical protein